MRYAIFVLVHKDGDKFVMAVLILMIGLAYGVYQYIARKKTEHAVDEILRLYDRLEKIGNLSSPDAQETIRDLIIRYQSIRNLDCEELDIEKRIQFFLSKLQ